MILHVAGLEKFIPPFVRLVGEEFQEETHQFWFTGSIEKYPVKLNETVYVCGNGFWGKLRGYTRLIKQLFSARKVMLHGLFNKNVILLLALCPWVLPKCHWVIWGGDLYQYKKANSTWRSRFKEALRRFVIRRLGHLVTYVEGDIELARQWYGAQGVRHECIMYLSNVVDPETIADKKNRSGDTCLNILLGNSADPSNNHFEALERLLPYKDQNIKIYVPLSYGDQIYARELISRGKNWFGEKFVPMTDFMPIDQYLEFLQGLDIAIFNHQRQQAMGNIITLLGMGKRVFMRNDVSHRHFLSGLGIILSDIAELEFKPLRQSDAQENARIIRWYFSRTNLIAQLRGVLEE